MEFDIIGSDQRVKHTGSALLGFAGADLEGKIGGDKDESDTLGFYGAFYWPSRGFTRLTDEGCLPTEWGGGPRVIATFSAPSCFKRVLITIHRYK